MVDIKRGALSRDELMALWQSVTDEEFARPMLEQAEDPEAVEDGVLAIAAYEQAAEQLAAVSSAIERNTQAMFILPHSQQTDDPAAGAQYARTYLNITRDALFEVPLVFRAGDIVFEHLAADYSKDGTIEVSTGRVYVLETSGVLGAGNPGPLQLNVVAANPGYGYNRPLEGTIKRIVQPGVGFVNGGASVQNNPGTSNRIIASSFPDVPITDHIGQYLQITGGANAGRVLRIIGIENPDPAVPHGGVFNVAAEALLFVNSLTGSFSYGDRIIQPLSGAEGQFLGIYGQRMLVLRTKGVFTGTDPIESEFGATAAVLRKEVSELLIEENYACSWRVADWNLDLHVSVTNPFSPAGGVAGYLDELGNERGLPRLANEDDEAYRLRVSVPADVVTPGAVLRTGNAILEPYDESICLREVGRPTFAGMFFDGAPNNAPFAYDLDLVEMTMVGGNQPNSLFAFFDAGPAGFFDSPTPYTLLNFFSTTSPVSGLGTGNAPEGFIPGERVSSVDANGIITTGIAQFDYAAAGSVAQVFRGVVRVRGPGFQVGRLLRGHVSGWQQEMQTVGPGVRPEHRWNVWLSLREFRGFFVVGVPRLALQDFGIFFDNGPHNAFDTNVVNNAFDGAALGTNSLYARLYHAIDGVRPAGIPFDLYIEDVGCV